MIGILLALQVNNWNDQKNNKASEHEFVLGVESDLLQDKKLLIIELDDMSKRLDEIDILLDIIPNGYKSNQMLIDSLFQDFLKVTQTFYPQSGTFESAISSGELSKYKEKAFLSQVHNLYKTLYPKLVYNGEIVDNRSIRFIEKYAHFRRTGKLGKMNVIKLSELMDDIYRGKTGTEFRKSRLSKTLESINDILSSISEMNRDL